MTNTLVSEPKDTACCDSTCCAEEPAVVTTQTSAPADIKAAVRDTYAEIATTGETCCGTGGSCGYGAVDMIGDAYAEMEGYVADADLRLGCGVPTEYADLHPGQTVLDLGAGAGLDAFVARRIVGEAGRVFGVDMTPEMVARARANADKLGYDNVYFIEGDIENLPLPDNSVDVVISNCVLNLVPDKARAFAEIYRVLRPGGHFCVSDVVSRGTLPDAVKQSVELYVGCVAGAMDIDAYLHEWKAAGLEHVEIAQARIIDVPDAALEAVASAQARSAVQKGDAALMSVTVTGFKP